MQRIWAPDELVEHCTLNPTELELFANKPGGMHLSFGLSLAHGLITPHGWRNHR